MIAFLGTGLLGAGFVRALLRRGETVHVWNRSADKARALEADGAVAFDDVAEAVRGADRVHVCLSDDAAVDAVLDASRAGLAPGVVIVDHTTTSADGAARRAAEWAEAGTPYVHAPVFMGPQNADDATGTMLVSGDPALVARVRPALDAMTGTLVDLGPDPAHAAGVKLVGNLLFIGLSGTLTDAFALARGFALPEQTVEDLIGIFNAGPLLAGRARRLRARTYDDPSWNLAMARKDARLMEEAATAAEVPLTVIPALGQAMDALLPEHAADDWSVVTRDALGPAPDVSDGNA